MNDNPYKMAIDEVRFDPEFDKKTIALMLQASQRKAAVMKIKNYTFGGLLAVACIAALIFSFPFIQGLQRTGDTASATSAMTSACAATTAADQSHSTSTTTAAAQTSQAVRTIVEPDNYNVGIMSYSRPEPGEIIIASGINAALDDPANSDSLYRVWIDVIVPAQYANTFDQFVYNGKTIAQWLVLVDLADGTYPYSEYNGDHGGNVTVEEWEQLQEDAKTLQAKENCDAAKEKYMTEVYPGVQEAKKPGMLREYDRLLQLGYDVSLYETWEYYGEGDKQYFTILTGLLTKSQIEEFKADSDYGYFLEWLERAPGR